MLKSPSVKSPKTILQEIRNESAYSGGRALLTATLILSVVGAAALPILLGAQVLPLVAAELIIILIGWSLGNALLDRLDLALIDEARAANEKSKPIHASDAPVEALAHYSLRIDGSDKGPFTLDQLRELRFNGKIHDSDQVQCSITGNAQSLRSIIGTQ